MQDRTLFCLDSNFIEKYINKEPNWGPVGKITYVRTYARSLDTINERLRNLGLSNGLTNREEFWLTTIRVIEGMFQIQQKHCLNNKLPWNNKKAQKTAQEAFERMWAFKWLPPGRGLWMMGTEFVDKYGSACLQNCSFVSTENINEDFAEPFCFLMEMSMLGVGVGGDTRGAGKIIIQNPTTSEDIFVVEDSREGWVEALKVLLNAFVGVNKLPLDYDFSLVRGPGQAIKGFGGVSSGPEPLKELLSTLKSILYSNVGTRITSTLIVDLFNLIGRCVVAGGVRRSSILMLGNPEDLEFSSLKDYSNLDEYHQKAISSWRWASNNSVLANVGINYTELAKLTVKNGEPGYLWLDNIQRFGRIKDKPLALNNKDKAIGSNPCAEISLENQELCNLCESFPANHENYKDFERTLKYAYMYAKTVSLVMTHNSKTNTVLGKNRRIGMSMSGIVQAISKFGYRNFINMADQGYDYIKHLDKVYSDWLCVPRSVKISTVKPSGTVSLLVGATAGMHYPESEFYYRVIRFGTDSVLLNSLRAAGYACIEIDPAKEPNTTAVYFPVREEHFLKSKQTVSMWEQLNLAADLQKYWADNQVSATITFNKEEGTKIADALAMYEDRLKSISFLPITDHKYEHAPYQPITEEEYIAAVSKLNLLNLSQNAGNEVQDKYCEGDKCTVPVKV